VTSAWVGAGCDRWGLWLGCRKGMLVECSCYLGFRLAALAPRLLETQPSCATQTLKRSYRKIIKDDEDF